MRPMAPIRNSERGTRKAARTSLIGAAIIAVIAAAWLYDREPLRQAIDSNVRKAESTADRPTSQPRSAGKSATPDSGSRRGEVVAGRNALVPSSPPLQPPVGTPVKEVIEQLRPDADAGVPTAACRVGAELARCWQNREFLRQRSRDLARLSVLAPESEEARNIRMMDADLLTQTTKDSDLCEGVSSDLVDEGWRYLLNAAHQGNVAAMEQFVLGPPMSPTQVMSSLDGWVAYREFGAGFLQRSIEGGSVRALYFAFISAKTGLGVGGQSLMPRDPYRAIVYGQAALPLVDQLSARMIMDSMSELQRAAGSRASAAAQEGAALRQRYFAIGARAETSAGLGRPNPGQCLQ